MKLTELLEEDREALLRTLRGAGEPARAQEALERELDRLLFAYNDAAPSPRQRESASAMLAALRAALPLSDSVGEVRIWESRPARKSPRLSALPLALLLFGCAACVAAAALMYAKEIAPAICALPLLGGAALALFSVLSGRGRAPAAERKTEAVTDWDKVYRTLHTAALVMDQTLEDTASAERWEQRRRDTQGAEFSPAELGLMAELLEGLYAADGEYALEKLGAVRHYLRARDVELVDYDPQHAELFDRMPGAEEATLCPALVQRGHVLRRGTATVAEQ